MTIERPITHDDPDVCVVIPTIPENSHEQVTEDLRNQTYDQFEVLVVNDRTKSVCEARNNGLNEAKAPVVAFTDDDCRPPEGWINNIVSCFQKYDDIVIIEGPVRGGMSYDGKQKYPTCNIAVDRRTAIDAGGFDIRFEYWREDTEFGWRMEEYGRAVFCEAVRMHHPDRPRSSVKQKNEQLLKEIHPDKYKQVIIPDTLLGRLNHTLWQRGFWEFVNKIRYEQ